MFITGEVYYVSTEAGNLISANPMIDTISQTLISIELQTVLDPRIKPGNLVNLKKS